MLQMKANSIKLSDTSPGKYQYRKVLKAAIKSRSACNRATRQKGKNCKEEFIAEK